MPAHAGGPGGGGLDAFGEGVVGEGEADDAAGAGVHGCGEEAGAGVGGDQDDADRGEAQDEVADEVEGGDGPDALVDEDDLGQLVDGLGGEPREGVEQRGGVADRQRGLGVGKLPGERGQRTGRVDVADRGEDPSGHT